MSHDVGLQYAERMDTRKTALERAFELASSGKCLNVTDIALRLKGEGYSIEQIEGPMLKKQLYALIEASIKDR